MNYIDSIKSVDSLDKLCCDLSERIYQYRDQIEKLLSSKTLSGLGNAGKGPLITPDEIDKIYNSAISQEAKQAWIWYKQSLGIPMKGWERFMPGASNSWNQLVYATKECPLQNVNHIDVGNVQKGALVGKYIKTTNDGVFVRTQGSVCIVSADTVKISKTKSYFSEKKLAELVKAKALFYVDGELLPYPIYAYANIYDRIQQLIKDEKYIKDTYGEDVYKYQWEIVNKSESAEFPHGAKPPVRSCMADDPKDRMIISPISDFARSADFFSITTVRDEYLDIESAKGEKYVNGRIVPRKNKEQIVIKLDSDQKYSLQHVFKKYLEALSPDKFDVSDAAFIIQYYLENKRYVNNQDSDSASDKKKSKDEANILKSNAKIDGDRLFQVFLHDVLTVEDQMKLDISWNRMYNAIAPIKYTQVPIMFTASRLFKGLPLKLKDMQREVLGFFETVGSGIVSLDVGGGKTICMIASIAMGLQQGKFKRPLLVLPNPVYGQFIREMIGYTYTDDNGIKRFAEGVLSGCGIEINDWYNLGSAVRDKLGTKPKVKDNTITVITKEGLKALGFSSDFFKTSTFTKLRRFFSATDAGDKKSDRQESQQNNNFQATIGIANAGSVYDFDKLGFDAIYADEAHNYRNAFSSVPAENGDDKEEFRYGIQGATSQLAKKMFFFAHFVQSKYGRNVVMATATPFQKAVLDVFGMLSLVGLDVMQNNNIYNLRQFCDMFINQSVEYVATMANEIVLQPVIKSFHNASVLRNIIQSLIYYREKKHFTNVKLPCKIQLPLINYEGADGVVRRLPADKQITTYLAMTKEQKDNQQEINNSFKFARDTMNRGNYRENSAELLRAMTEGRQNAFSSHYYKGVEPDSPTDFILGAPKIHAACLVIKNLREKYGKNMPGQIIYANFGVNFFGLIKQFLVQECGLTEKEVAIIRSETSDSRKVAIKDGFNSGEIKVIIGTSTISEGLNLQERSTDIHVVASEWNPTTLVQLAGRIHRQGNPHGYVRFIVYLVQDSCDVPMFQKCEEKIARLNELLQRNGDPVIGGDTIDANEIKYGLITDTDNLAQMDFDVAKKEYAKLIQKEAMELSLIEAAISKIDDYNTQRQRMIRGCQRYATNYKVLEYLNKKADEYESKEKKQKLKKLQEHLKYISDKAPQMDNMDDSGILDVCRTIEKALTVGKEFDYYLITNFELPRGIEWRRPFNWEENHFYNEFKEAYITLKKCEELTLKKRGFSRNSDLNLVLEDSKARVNDMKRYHAQYFGEGEGKGDTNSQAYQEIYAKIVNIKKRIAVSGQSPAQVAANIGKLDYLLDYTIENRPCSGYCRIPNVEDDAAPEALTIQLKEAEKVMNIDGTYPDEIENTINGIDCTYISADVLREIEGDTISGTDTDLKQTQKEANEYFYDV